MNPLDRILMFCQMSLFWNRVQYAELWAKTHQLIPMNVLTLRMMTEQEVEKMNDQIRREEKI